MFVSSARGPGFGAIRNWNTSLVKATGDAALQVAGGNAQLARQLAQQALRGYAAAQQADPLVLGNRTAGPSQDGQQPRVAGPTGQIPAGIGDTGPSVTGGAVNEQFTPKPGLPGWAWGLFAAAGAVAAALGVRAAMKRGGKRR